MTRRIQSVVLAVVCLAVVSCGADSDEPYVAHPDLECSDDEQSIHPPADIDISGPGAATADEALRTNLGQVIEFRGGGEIVLLTEVEYAVVVDDRSIHISRAGQNVNGEWHVIDIFYCESPSSNDDVPITPATIADVPATDAEVLEN